MSSLYIRLLSFLIILGAASPLRATHNLGAEVRYTHVAGSTYSIEVYVYSDLSSPTDRPEIIVDFGDGTRDTIPRISIVDDLTGSLCYSARLSIYQSQHEYPGPGEYRIRFADNNRAPGIVNIPGSVERPLCIEALLIISPDLTANNSPRFEGTILATTMNWNTWYHDPVLTESDGDVIVCELVPALGAECQPIPGYAMIEGAHFVMLDQETGVLAWNYPLFNGEFSVCIRASEYRNGSLIGQVTRDMTICVAGFAAGLSEPRPAQDLTITPSLTTRLVWITELEETSTNINVLDASGRTVLTHRAQGPTAEIDLVDLSAGTYIVQARSPNGTVRTGRIVKH